MRTKLEIMKERRKAQERKKAREHLTEQLLQKQIRDELKKSMPSVFPRLNW